MTSNSPLIGFVVSVKIRCFEHVKYTGCFRILMVQPSRIPRDATRQNTRNNILFIRSFIFKKVRVWKFLSNFANFVHRRQNILCAEIEQRWFYLLKEEISQIQIYLRNFQTRFPLKWKNCILSFSANTVVPSVMRHCIYFNVKHRGSKRYQNFYLCGDSN